MKYEVNTRLVKPGVNLATNVIFKLSTVARRFIPMEIKKIAAKSAVKGFSSRAI